MINITSFEKKTKKNEEEKKPAEMKNYFSMISPFVTNLLK